MPELSNQPTRREIDRGARFGYLEQNRTDANNGGNFRMSRERTLAMIKPDGVARGLSGSIIQKIEQGELRVAALKMTRLSHQEAEKFYAVHQERPFFQSLIKYICSGVIVAVVLEGTDAVKRFRELIGATDPHAAVAGSIRAEWGISVEENTIHGSDSPESADVEIPFFFDSQEILHRFE